MPVFQAKVPQSYDEWLEQIDKVTSLTNKDPYKLALEKSQGSFSRMINPCQPSMASVQNAIMLAQKKDAELCIMEGLHSHHTGHEINNIASKQVNDKNSIGPCHACSSLHLV